MDLKKQSELISCNHIKFLDNKYKLYNDMEFKKKMVCNVNGNVNGNVNANVNGNINDNYGYLKSSFITKKDCFYKPIEDKERLWEVNFIPVTNNQKLFNLNTSVKIDYDAICHDYKKLILL